MIAAAAAFEAQMKRVQWEGPIIPVDHQMHAIARMHARRGFRVFPCAWIMSDGQCSCYRGRKGECANPGKHPYLKGWRQDATTDLEQIADWWSSYPHANIGICTDGMLVLDEDPRKGGAESRKALEAEHGVIDTLTAITGSEGRHYLFTLPDGIRCRNKVCFAPGLDTRADGGFIIAVGSWHACGGRYRWDGAYRPMSEAPAWLLALVNPPKPTPPESTPQERPINIPTSRLEKWGARGMWCELQTLSQVSEGVRNERLNHHAFRIGQLVGAGAVTREEAEDRLHAMGTQIGLTPVEVRQTVRSGLNAGIGKPRYPVDRPRETKQQNPVGRPAYERTERGGVAISQGAAATYDLLLEHIQCCDPGNTPHCRLTVAQVAQALGKNERTARRYLAELKDAGLCDRRRSLHGCETIILAGAPEAAFEASESGTSIQDINYGPIKEDLLTNDTEVLASLSAEFVSASCEAATEGDDHGTSKQDKARAAGDAGGVDGPDGDAVGRGDVAGSNASGHTDTHAGNARGATGAGQEPVCGRRGSGDLPVGGSTGGYRRRPLLDLVADAVEAYGIPLSGPMAAPDGYRQNKLDLIIDFVFSNEGDVYSDEQIKWAWETYRLRAKLGEIKYLSQVKGKLKSAQYHIDRKQYEGKSPAWWLWYQREIAAEVKRREAAAEQERKGKRHQSRRNVVPTMHQTMVILDCLMTGASDEERDAEIARLLEAGDVSQALAVADVYQDTNPERYTYWQLNAEIAREVAR